MNETEFLCILTMNSKTMALKRDSVTLRNRVINGQIVALK